MLDKINELSFTRINMTLADCYDIAIFADIVDSPDTIKLTMPVIAIEGMVFHAPVGVYPSEKLLGNDLEVSVKLALQESGTAHEDDLACTVDYEAIYALVRKIIAEPVNLLETAVSRIIASIFLEYPPVSKVKVRVAKLHPPVNGTVKKVWVEETRTRNSKKKL